MSSTKVTPTGDNGVKRRRSSLRRFATHNDQTSTAHKYANKKVRLKHVLKVSQEYHGFRSMFIAAAAAFAFMNVSSYHFEFPGDSFTQAAVLNLWTSTKDGRSVWDVTSMENSGKYTVDWLADHVQASLDAGSTDTLLIENQYRVLAYHITLEYTDPSMLYHNKSKNTNEYCAHGFGRGNPCRSVYSYRRPMSDADYQQYTTWNKDLSPDIKAALRPNPNSTNLIDALRTLRALSHDTDHWLTTQSHVAPDDAMSQTTSSSILEGPPFYIPKRSTEMPSWLMVRMLYDTDNGPWNYYEDSSRRIIVLSGMGFTFPFISAADFLNSNKPASFYAYRVGESGFYDQYWVNKLGGTVGMLECWNVGMLECWNVGMF